jgi:putative transposase
MKDNQTVEKAVNHRRTTADQSNALLFQIPAVLITEEDWKNIIPLLPKKIRAQARNGKCPRKFVEAVLWVAHTQLYWKDLPPQYGMAPHAAYMRFTRWARAGVWQKVINAMTSSGQSAERLAWMVMDYLGTREMRAMVQAIARENNA